MALQCGGLYNCPCHQWGDLLAVLWHFHFAKHFVWQARMLTIPWSQSVHKNRQLIPRKCQRMGFISLKPIISYLFMRPLFPSSIWPPLLISRLRSPSNLHQTCPDLCHTQHVKNRTYLVFIPSLSSPLPKMWLRLCLYLSECTRFHTPEPCDIH